MHGRDERGDRGDLDRRAERRADPHSSVGGAAREPSHPSAASLPDAIRTQSLSADRLILPLDAALQAIDLLTGAGQRVDVWEGWVRMRDGARARSLAHAGSFALPRDPHRAAEAAREGMRAAQAHWDRNPEYPGATLYFGVAFVPTT